MTENKSLTATGAAISADEARMISGENQKLVRYMREIRSAAGGHHRTALLAYTDCCGPDDLAAFDDLRSAGFEVFRHAETLGGVLQQAAWYARW